MKVLIIEDEKKISAFIENGLRSERYAVDTAANGKDGLYLAFTNKYDLLILDIMLPEVNGITICKELRNKKLELPIIMLSALDSVDDRVKGLNAGADDYLVKPFSFDELLARIKALTRRSNKDSSETIILGELIIDPEDYSVERKGKKLKLTATEFKLLEYLMKNKGRIVSKTLLLANVWGYNFSPESNIVDVYIKYLRDKIDKGYSKKMIITVRGLGYKICA
jgi:DNA-binding response OmpR family regulator